MKKLTRERVVPIISASVSWLSFGREASVGPSQQAERRYRNKHPSIWIGPHWTRHDDTSRETGVQLVHVTRTNCSSWS